MIVSLRNTYRKFSKHFWVLMFASFIDMLGGALIFPFFSLFITQKFNISITQLGSMYLVWALTSSLLGNTLGGALADKFGRKTNMIMGLVASAVSALLMVVINDFAWFFLAIGVVGVFQDIAGPARGAMIADLVPEDLRVDAYGVFRIVFNLAATIGPIIGGLIGAINFNLLFLADVVISLGVAVFVFYYLRETKPQHENRKEESSLRQTFKGYWQVLKDKLFMAFLAVALLEVMTYIPLNTILGVYLRDVHGITTERFGFLLSLNAFMVVVMQMGFSRLVAGKKPMLVMAFGTLLYALGFSMYAYTSTYILFVLAIVIITIGEMILAPVEQSLVAVFAPEDMRGRYMAIHGLVWIIPFAIGPLGAGLIMDNFNPRLLWLVDGAIGMIAVFGYLALHLKAGQRFIDRQNGNSNHEKKSKMEKIPLDN